jgi:hypothetical protein
MQLTFRPLTLEDQAAYNDLLARASLKTSDYCFLNLWAWKDIYDLEWAFEQDLVWIRQNAPERAYWAPVGPWASISWRNRLYAHFREPAFFIRIPEPLHELWRGELPEAVRLQPDRDHFDYLYRVRDLIELRGNKLHKKKNLLRQFLRSYDFDYLHLTPERIDKALTMQTEWCLWRDCESSTTLEAENQAIVNIFHDWSRLSGLLGGGIEIEGNMVAYTVAEPLDEETVVIHFEKGCPNYKGVYQAINQMFLERSAADYTYVNREQDLGDAGLRQAKESYNPTGFLKKFSGCFEPL